MKGAEYFALERTIRNLLGFEIGTVRVRHFRMPGGADVLLVRDPELATTGRVFVALEAGRFPILEGSNVDALDLLRAYAATHKPPDAMQIDAMAPGGVVMYHKSNPAERREFPSYAVAKAEIDLLRSLVGTDDDTDTAHESISLDGTIELAYVIRGQKVGPFVIKPKR